MTRTYSLDEQFFNNIDTENKAYWLGFVLADGNINKYSNTLSISLKRSDKFHLYKFVSDLKSNYRVVDFINSNGSKQSRLCVTSKEVKINLVKKGITPNKSLDVKAPCMEGWSTIAKIAFWRGCVDGDGSIFKTIKNNRVSWGVNLLGTKSVVDNFAKFVSVSLGIKVKKATKAGKIFKVSYEGSETPIRVIELIYNNAGIYLDRKMDIAKEAISSERRRFNNYVDRKKYTQEYLLSRYTKLKTWEKVAEHESIGISTLGRIRRELNMEYGRK